MTTDGQYLIVTDGSNYIHFWDPITHMEVGWLYAYHETYMLTPKHLQFYTTYVGFN